MVRYLSIAHNERAPGGASVPKNLLSLGREDALDVPGLRRLVASVTATSVTSPGPRPRR